MDLVRVDLYLRPDRQSLGIIFFRESVHLRQTPAFQPPSQSGTAAGRRDTAAAAGKAMEISIAAEEGSPPLTASFSISGGAHRQLLNYRASDDQICNTSLDVYVAA